MFERFLQLFRDKSRDDEAHRVALARLQRDQVAKAEYMRVRVDEALADTFDAWDGESEAPSPTTNDADAT